MKTLIKRGIRKAHDARSGCAFPIAVESAVAVPSVKTGSYQVFHADAFAWPATAPECSVEAVVTDPPYGLLEYTDEQLKKRKNGKGGIWRIPPSFDGCRRSPLPRFTVLNRDDHGRVRLLPPPWPVALVQSVLKRMTITL
jgi:hypothetical protein